MSPVRFWAGPPSCCPLKCQQPLAGICVFAFPASKKPDFSLDTRIEKSAFPGHFRWLPLLYASTISWLAVFWSNAAKKAHEAAVKQAKSFRSELPFPTTLRPEVSALNHMSLAQFAHENGKAFVAKLSREEQKSLGQFMTPYPIAEFMARRSVTGIAGGLVRVLEPSAGAGVLAAAVIEQLLSLPEKPSGIELTLCEIDARLQPCLKALASKLRATAKQHGVSLSCSIVMGDFLLSSLARSAEPKFDICIANPPYFKLNKADPRAIAHSYAVYGQPNIYGLFQAACAGLLAPGGSWCFITPRSWMNGAYFSAVRRHLLQYLHIDALHLFESRQDHFYEDTILQEAVIAWATAHAPQSGQIAFSTSNGVADLQDAELFAVPSAQVIGADHLRMISVPVAAGADQAGDVFAEWTDTLATLGLKVSTGPVVAFRSRDFIREKHQKGCVPLLWMQHVTRAGVRWPIQKKQEHIQSSALTAWMLLPNGCYVVMRRFSPKEDIRRVTSAPYLGVFKGKFIGLENHLNYIHRPGGAMGRDEVVGVSAFMNSTLVDGYFRAVSGNTQVNATELRKLHFPPLAKLVAIGKKLPDSASLEQIDKAVAQVLKLSQILPSAASG